VNALCEHKRLMKQVMEFGQGAVLAQRPGSIDFVCSRCGGLVYLEVFCRPEPDGLVWGYRVYDLALRS
jgi:DNA-directed RNA polymerase subunit RPC12/RpoP